MSENRPTIYDVARHAGLSISSVSRVLNGCPQVSEDVRRRVEESVELLEYEPSKEAQRLGRRGRVTANEQTLRNGEQLQPLRLCLVGAARQVHLASANLQVTASLTAEELAQEGALPGAPDAIACMLPEDRKVLNRVVRVAREAALPLVALTDGREVSEAEALLAGADVAASPVEEKLLQSRLRAWHRSHTRMQTRTQEGSLEVGRLRIDRFRRLLYVDEKEVEVTSNQLLMLELLAEQPGRVRSREQLGERAWPAGKQPADRTINMHVRKVRGKLRERGLEGAIETVRGVGYRLAPKQVR